jgi:hypothetical protein
LFGRLADDKYYATVSRDFDSRNFTPGIDYGLVRLSYVAFFERGGAVHAETDCATELAGFKVRSKKPDSAATTASLFSRSSDLKSPHLYESGHFVFMKLDRVTTKTIFSPQPSICHALGR